jgi:tetratricopeptide (TPR) repeat protein
MRRTKKPTNGASADTFRVISLSFSNLGGTEVVNEYFGAKGKRSYEDRIYSNLGEFYLTKLRYHDAAAAYKAFVALYPFHRTSPRFSMRVVEIYTKGGFPKLVLDSKKEFAKTYGLKAEYWRHFPVEESPEVLSYLKSNLRDLAIHYHAQYQVAELADERPANYEEALLWYREFLSSFPEDSESPAINYQLADLLLEEKNYGEAAREYERTAYNYPPHEKASAAGYAAIFAHRENLKIAPEEQEGSHHARGRCELAQVCGCVPLSTSRRRPCSARPRRPVRFEGIQVRDGRCTEAHRAISGDGSADPPLCVDRRGSFLVRAGGVPAGRKRLYARTRADATGRRQAPGARGQPCSVDLQAG